MLWVLNGVFLNYIPKLECIGIIVQLQICLELLPCKIIFHIRRWETKVAKKQKLQLTWTMRTFISPYNKASRCREAAGPGYTSDLQVKWQLPFAWLPLPSAYRYNIFGIIPPGIYVFMSFRESPWQTFISLVIIELCTFLRQSLARRMELRDCLEMVSPPQTVG